MASQIPISQMQQMKSPMTASRGSSSTGPCDGTKLLLFIATEKTTPFSPMLLEKMARVKTMQAQWAKLVERMRITAQPNPVFRGERLVASAVNQVSFRNQYAMALKDASVACFDNVKPLAVYTDEMSNGILAMASYEEVFLRQVMLFAVKPLKDFVDVHFRKIMAEFAELEKRRDRYDASRKKMSDKTPEMQQKLLEQAAELEKDLDAVPKHQMDGAKAVDTYLRAESQYFKEILSVIKAIKAPESKKRWSTP